MLVVIVNLLLGDEASLDFPSANAAGDSPLGTAVATKNARAVSVLLEKGANVNWSRASDGYTPVHIAVAVDSAAILMLLAAHVRSPSGRWGKRD